MVRPRMSGPPGLFLLGALLAAGALFLPGGSPPAAAGPLQGAPPKSLIYAGWFGNTIPTPSYVAANFSFLESRPFHGLVLFVRNTSLTINASHGVMSNTPMSFADISSVLDPVRNLPFSQLKDNFAYVVGTGLPDFFADWSIPIQNFANLAHALKDAGIKGIFLDNEQYNFFPHWAEYPDGVADPTKTLAEYQAQARLRGKEVMEAMVAEYPEIVVLSLHGPYVSEPDAPFQLFFPLAVPRNALTGPFFAGFYEGKGPSSTVVDGGEFYVIRSATEFADNAAWRRTTFPSAAVNCAFLPDALRATWPATISIAFGSYDSDFGGRTMNSSILTPTLQNALAGADRYAWFYTEGRTFLKPESDGGATQEWVNAVRVAVGLPPEGGGGGSGGSSGGCGLLGIEVVPVLLGFYFLRSRRGRGLR